MRQLTLEKYKELQTKTYEGMNSGELELLLLRISCGDTDAADKYNQKFVDILNEYFGGEV